MNREIKDKVLKTDTDEGKKQQAYAMEESRLHKAKKICTDTGVCDEFNQLGGDARLKEVERLVHIAQDTNYNAKKTGMDAGRENQFQDKKKGTEVGVAMVTKGSDHSGPSTTNKIMSNDEAIKTKKSSRIMTNSEALSEVILKEISSIRYLIEYINNNNKKQNL